MGDTGIYLTIWYKSPRHASNTFRNFELVLIWFLVSFLDQGLLKVNIKCSIWFFLLYCFGHVYVYQICPANLSAYVFRHVTTCPTCWHLSTMEKKFCSFGDENVSIFMAYTFENPDFFGLRWCLFLRFQVEHTTIHCATHFWAVICTGTQ